MALSLAFTDPRSPFFQETMKNIALAVVHHKAIKKLDDFLAWEVRKAELDNKKMLHEEWLRSAREQKKYVAAYETYQSAQQKLQRDFGKMWDARLNTVPSADLANHLRVEIAALQFELTHLAKEEKEIATDWAAKQDDAVDNFLREDLAAVLPTGETVTLTDAHKEKLRPLLKAPSPLDICRIIPDAVDYTPQAIVTQNVLMGELKLGLALARLSKKAISFEEASLHEKISAPPVLDAVRRNPVLRRQFSTRMLESSVESDFTSIVERAQSVHRAARVISDKIALYRTQLDAEEKAHTESYSPPTLRRK